MTWPSLARPVVMGLALVILSSSGAGAPSFQAEFGPGGTDAKVFAAGSSAAVKAELKATPTTAVPNQSVVLIGTNFSSVSTPGGPGSGGAHQITGSGASIVTAGGNLMTSPYINYPIQFDSGGTWSATVTIPGNSTIFSLSTLRFVARDTGGASASIGISLRKRSVKLDTTSSRVGSTVRIEGKGFPANTSTSPDTFRVNITYGTTSVKTVSPDSSGEFDTTFLVPTNAVIPSKNTVTAKVVGTTATATISHSIPGATISIVPKEGPSGTPFKITGSNFRAFRSVSTLSIGVPTVLPSASLSTDQNGSFQVSGVIPGLEPGVKVVAANVGGVNSFTSFTVLKPAVPLTPTPAPTPTPGPATGPAQGLSPLIEADNLVRVWHFDPATQNVPPRFGWSLFDPRPLFAPANTVTDIRSGQFYWVSVKQAQTVTLKGKQRALFAGWNPVSW